MKLSYSQHGLQEYLGSAIVEGSITIFLFFMLMNLLSLETVKKNKKKRFAGQVESEFAALESSQRDDCWGGAQLYQREMKIQRHCYKTNK